MSDNLNTEYHIPEHNFDFIGEEEIDVRGLHPAIVLVINETESKYAKDYSHSQRLLISGYFDKVSRLANESRELIEAYGTEDEKDQYAIDSAYISQAKNDWETAVKEHKVDLHHPVNQLTKAIRNAELSINDTVKNCKQRSTK